MITSSEAPPAPVEASGHKWTAYALPFLTLLGLLGLSPYLPVAPQWRYLLRTLIVLGVLLVCSRSVIRLKPSRWAASIALGVAVFVLWILPETLFPGYRHHWLFENALLGTGASSVPPAARANPFLMMVRIAGSALLVPVVEELFWRAWVMRRLISADFKSIPPGTYAADAFWITAVLFASEHGPYWDVGLVAGIAYNWWMVRTRSLADCILAHAVTNACLGAWVLSEGQWQYWH